MMTVNTLNAAATNCPRKKRVITLRMGENDHFFTNYHTSTAYTNYLTSTAYTLKC